MRTALGLALVLLAAAPVRARPADLRWQPREGSLLEIRVKSTTRVVTAITGEDGKEDREEETLRQRVVLEARVRGVLESGSLDLRLRVASFRTEQTSGGRGVVVSGEREEEGDPRVEVKILGKGAASRSVGTRTILSKLAMSLLSCRWSVVLTPRGEVVSATTEGDPFADLDPEGFASRTLARLGRVLLPEKDLASLATGGIFVLLPGEPVVPGDSWKVTRGFRAAGIEMEGEGSATLERVVEVRGAAVAEIRETLRLRVSTAEHDRMLGDLLEEACRTMGVPAAVRISFDDQGEVVATSRSTFDVGAGRAMRTDWEELRLPFRGRVLLTAFGETTRLGLMVDLTIGSEVEIHLKSP